MIKKIRDGFEVVFATMAVAGLAIVLTAPDMPWNV